MQLTSGSPAADTAAATAAGAQLTLLMKSKAILGIQFSSMALAEDQTFLVLHQIMDDHS